MSLPLRQQGDLTGGGDNVGAALDHALDANHHETPLRQPLGVIDVCGESFQFVQSGAQVIVVGMGRLGLLQQALHKHDVARDACMQIAGRHSFR